MRYLIKTCIINRWYIYIISAFITCITCMFHYVDNGLGNAFVDKMVYVFGGFPYGYDPLKEGIPLEYNSYILQMVILLALGGLADTNVKADVIRRFGIKRFVVNREIVLSIQVILWGIINLVVIGLLSGDLGTMGRDLTILYSASYLFKIIPLIIILFQLVFILDMIVKNVISIVMYIVGLLFIMIIPGRMFIVDNLFFKRSGVINGWRDFIITITAYILLIVLMSVAQIKIKTKQDFANN